MRILLPITVAALSLASLGAQSPAARPGDDLIGLWGNEATFGPAVRGAMTLRRAQQRWTMTIAGFEVAASTTADTIRITLPDGQGSLRFRRPHPASVIHAFWIQPEGNGPSYATPVTLTPAGPDSWRGDVMPLAERFSLYLTISRDSTGSLIGAFQNPEARWNGGAARFRVSRQGDELAFTDPASGTIRLRQPYDSSQRRIIMDFGGPIPLVPRTLNHAVGYLPHSPAVASAGYRVPLPGGDGWPTARAAAVGLDERQLGELVQRIATTDPARRDTPLRIHSILVARDGRLVLEEYFYGYSADRPHDLRSASKVFASLLAGIAMDQGAAFTMQSPVMPLFGRSADGPKGRITVGQLLTHSSGLACDDNDDASPGNEDTMQGQRAQADWYSYILDLPMAHDPGSQYAYCSGGINLVAGIVHRATGEWLPDLFDREVARPLQFGHYALNLTPTGDAYGGGGAYLLPRDLLKIGQLYLDGGEWRGRRIVSRRWTVVSTAHQMTTDQGGSDGFGWHRHTLRVNGHDYQEYEANGNGGQFLIVVPSLDLAVVTTAGNYNQYPVWKAIREELVPQYIIAAIRTGRPAGGMKPPR